VWTFLSQTIPKPGRLRRLLQAINLVSSSKHGRRKHEQTTTRKPCLRFSPWRHGPLRVALEVVVSVVVGVVDLRCFTGCALCRAN
jgi:hypothetical protein